MVHYYYFIFALPYWVICAGTNPNPKFIRIQQEMPCKKYPISKVYYETYSQRYKSHNISHSTTKCGCLEEENQDVYSMLTNMDGMEPGSRVVLSKEMFERIANDIINDIAKGDGTEL